MASGDQGTWQGGRLLGELRAELCPHVTGSHLEGTPLPGLQRGVVQKRRLHAGLERAGLAQHRPRAGEAQGTVLRE